MEKVHEIIIIVEFVNKAGHAEAGFNFTIM